MTVIFFFDFLQSSFLTFLDVFRAGVGFLVDLASLWVVSWFDHVFLRFHEWLNGDGSFKHSFSDG